uniref:SH2 domain-containing protein n=1 Tax=Knipowitschia caucasica TaxID=637954 RepID=A0AAV2J4Y5_KNICA
MGGVGRTRCSGPAWGGLPGCGGRRVEMGVGNGSTTIYSTSHGRGGLGGAGWAISVGRSHAAYTRAKLSAKGHGDVGERAPKSAGGIQQDFSVEEETMAVVVTPTDVKVVLEECSEVVRAGAEVTLACGEVQLLQTQCKKTIWVKAEKTAVFRLKMEETITVNSTRSHPEPESQSLARPPVAIVTRSNSGARVPMNRSHPEPESQSLARPPVAIVTRSNSGARVPMNRFKLQAEPVPEDDFKHKSFPLHNKSMRPSVTSSLPPGLPSGLPPGLPSGLPSGLPPGLPSGLPSAPRFSGGAAAAERPAPKQDLDSLWYVGKVTRAEAEATLQRLGKDGAFVVRDSSRLSAHQPFTLMVQFQHKVYNIQIQRPDHKYLLGTGLKVQESFSTVRDMVDHFSQSPLILIDSKNRDSSLHSQCLLSVPAGPYMDRF